MDSYGHQASTLNDRHETRLNFLKKDKDQLERRLDDIEERLLGTKNTIQMLLVSSQSISEKEKNVLIDYLIEEKSYLGKKINDIKSENEEAKNKSLEQRQKITEIIAREPNIEADFNLKFEAALKESKEKEDSILKLSQKTEKLNREFKELAKNRLNASVSPAEIPELLETKRNAITRVISKVHEYAKYLEAENTIIEKSIEAGYKELWKLNCHAKYPFKIGKSMEEFTKPVVKNLVQADIRAKLEFPSTEIASLISYSKPKRKNDRIQSKLEEKFIKIDSLCCELKTAEIINQTLKEDRNYLLSSVTYLNYRKIKTKPTKDLEIVNKVHKRVVSNPLDYCLKEHVEIQEIDRNSKPDLDLDFSKELNNFSSVEENYYEGPGDSIIDDILDI